MTSISDVKLLLVVSICACGKAEPAPEPVKPKGPTAAELATREATDAVSVIRRYFETGQALAAQNWKSVECQSKTKGYDALLECEASALKVAEQAQKSLPAERIGTTECGLEIEKVHRDYIEDQVLFHRDRLEWLTKVKAVLAPRMVGKTQADACQKRAKACADEPFDKSDAYGSRINSIECTKALFQCLPGRDNVCFVGKVASRLGLGTEASSGTLLVKATGAEIH